MNDIVIVIIGSSIPLILWFYKFVFNSPTREIKKKIKKYNIKRGDVMFDISKGAFEKPIILTYMITDIDFKRKKIQYVFIPNYNKDNDKGFYLSNLRKKEYRVIDFEYLNRWKRWLFKCDGIKSKYHLEYLLKHYDDFNENEVKRMIVNYL